MSNKLFRLDLGNLSRIRRRFNCPRLIVRNRIELVAFVDM